MRVYALVLTLLALVPAAAKKHVVKASSATFESIIKKNSHVMVEFYAPWCGHCKKLEPDYESAAKMLHFSESKTKLVKVDATADRGLAKQYDVKGFPTMLLFVDGKKEGEKYKGARDALSIANFMHKSAGEKEEEDDSGAKEDDGDPLVNEITWDNADDYTEHEIQKQLLVCADFSDKNPKKAELLQAMSEAADTLNGDVLILYLDSKKRKNNGILSMVQAKSTRDCPLMRMASFKGGFKVWYEVPRDRNNKRFPITAEGMVKYVSAWSNGQLKRKMRSEMLPEPPREEQKVSTVVGINFNTFVDQDDADVMVFLYMRGCKFCEAFSEVYDKAAEKLASDTLQFGKMNGPSNDIDHAGVEYKAYPHVLFFPADDKKNPIRFEETHGDGSYDSLVDFLQIYGTTDGDDDEE